MIIEINIVSKNDFFGYPILISHFSNTLFIKHIEVLLIAGLRL